MIRLLFLDCGNPIAFKYNTSCYANGGSLSGGWHLPKV